MVTLASEVGTPTEARDAQPPATDAPQRPGRLRDLIAVAVYVIGAFYVTSRIWADLDHRVVANNEQDQGFFTFVLANAAHSILHLDNPLFSHQVNVPHGVNMMANTSILGLAIPLTPITLLFGAKVSFAVLEVLALSLTASAWYYVLSRHLVRSWAAAFIAGAFCGFTPGFVSQSNGHPNVAGQFMVPIILLQVARLRDTKRPVAVGAVLGLLVIYQAFINEEVLLFTAVAATLMVLVWAVSRREQVRARLRPAVLAVVTAGAIAGVVLAYPLHFQFFGPSRYGAVPELSVSYVSDVGSYFMYPTAGLGGSLSSMLGLRGHLAEQNSYFGWPLLILAAVTAVTLWRNLVVRSAAVIAVFFALMSLGPTVKVYGRDHHIPGPFRLVNWLPVIESVVPVRIALFVGPMLGVLLAFALDRVIRAPKVTGGPQLLWYAAFAAALVPLFPRPLPARDVPAAPTFVTAGDWKQYAPPGHSILVLPVPSIGALQGQRWSAEVNMDMPIPSGYFLGPDGPDGSRATYGAPHRASQNLLDTVFLTSQKVEITDQVRRQFVVDLKFWRTGAIIVGDVPKARQFRDTLQQLLGTPGQYVDGVWLWDVRSLVDG
jgi:uncharacterized membrane protein YhaH (DUF805 family)